MTKVYEFTKFKLIEGDKIKKAIMKLPLEQQDMEIAQWSLAMVDDYTLKPYPTMPPLIVEYTHKTAEQRKLMNENPWDYKSFWGSEEVIQFFHTRQTIRNLNNRNKDWLQWMGTILKDPKDKLKVEMALSTHKNKSTIPQPAWT